MADGPLLTPLDRRGDDPTRDLPRPEPVTDVVDRVAEILDDVRSRGDDAVRDHTVRLDDVDQAVAPLPAAVVADALEQVPAELRSALQRAHDRVRRYHVDQAPPERRHTADGITLEERYVPVERAGCYVPGGRARYPSTVLMTVAPARAAGVDEVVLCVPPAPDGSVPVETLAAAAIAGVDEVFAVGGAQAVGALAYGTEAVRAVDVIVGPGNVYVAEAKRQVAGVVGVPSAFAGPSEVVVVADDSAPPAFAATDLLVQAEHGPGGLAWLITWSEAQARAIGDEVQRRAEAADRRADIESTLASGGYSVMVDGPDAAMAVANAIAPEHLQLMVAAPASMVDAVRNAGAVFCGAHSPASLGDYVAGPSHVLPTNGSARFSGALSVLDFVKQLHVVVADADGLAAVADDVAVLARAEGLELHAQSVHREQL